MTAAGIATVARHEFRLRIRAGRWRRLLAAWFVVLLAFTLLLRSGLDAAGEAAVGIELRRGAVMYGGLMLFLLALALLVVPALAAQSVNGDRERGILATLQVTRLSAAELTLGKFAAAWGTALVFLAASAPLVVWTMAEGGVPLGRVFIVTSNVAILLGTVVALSLALSAVLSRTSTSSVLSYLTVFALTAGTLVLFGLVTAVTVEEYQARSYSSCYPPDGINGEPNTAESCQPDNRTYTATRPRTDRTWWLLAPNPFVVLADAAPTTGRFGYSKDDQGRVELDPLGALGDTVRDLRLRPVDEPDSAFLGSSPPVERKGKPVWPLGLAVNVLLAVGALALTVARLRTPSRNLPRGQRVA